MEKYTTSILNFETLESTQISTEIPKILVESIQNAFNKKDGELLLTPIMVNPDDLSVVFGVIDRTSATQKYRITISNYK